MSNNEQLANQVVRLRKVLDQVKSTLADRRAEYKEALRVLCDDFGVDKLDQVDAELACIEKSQAKQMRIVETGLRKAGETYEW